MGHSRLTTLPVSKKWREVVHLVATGADEAKIAAAVMLAIGGTFARVRDDAGFREGIRLITQLALAGGRPNPAGELAAVGLPISENTSLVDVVLSLGEEFDKRIDATRQRSDFAELTQRALVGAVTEHLKAHLPTLFAPPQGAVSAAFKELSKPAEFGRFFRGFVSGLTNGLLKSYLSCTLGTHLGEGQRFTTTNQIGLFEKAVKTHCDEASEIVEVFASQWFSKQRFKGAGDISREKAEGFGWVAFRKMSLELLARAKP